MNIENKMCIRQHNTSRYDYIDIIRFCAIFFVALCHLPINIEFRRFFYSFHVGLFFIISGYLYTKRDIRSEVAKCYRSLLLPYVVFSIVISLFVMSQPSNNVPFYKCLLCIFTGENYETAISYPCNQALWFVIALIWVRLINSLFSERKYYIVCLIIIICLEAFTNFYGDSNDINTLLSIDSAIIALPLFAIGRIFRRYQIGQKNVHCSSCLQIVWGGVVMFAILMFSLYNRCDVSNGRIGNHAILYYMMNAIVAMTCIITLSNFKIGEKTRRILRNFNDGLIVILALHQFVEFKIWFKLFHLDITAYSSYTYIFIGIADCILSFFVIYNIIVILKLYCPKVLGR